MHITILRADGTAFVTWLPRGAKLTSDQLAILVRDALAGKKPDLLIE